MILELAVDFGGLRFFRFYFFLLFKDFLLDNFFVFYRVGLIRLCRYVYIGLLIYRGLGEYGLVDGIGGYC